MRKYYLLLAFVAVISVVAGWASAQSVEVVPVPPTVLSGPDIGFRVEGHRAGTPVGRIVVRVNGAWVEVDASGGPTFRR